MVELHCGIYLDQSSYICLALCMLIHMSAVVVSVDAVFKVVLSVIDVVVSVDEGLLVDWEISVVKIDVDM